LDPETKRGDWTIIGPKETEDTDKVFFGPRTIDHSQRLTFGGRAKMAEHDGQDNELRINLTRFRVMESETTDPVALRFLHDIVVDLETELERYQSDGLAGCS
jgi:hypothetical protein